MIAGRVVGQKCGDNPTRREIGDLHSPKVHYIVHDVVAGAVHGIGAEDPRIRTDAGDGIALGIDQIEIIAAPILAFVS